MQSKTSSKKRKFQKPYDVRFLIQSENNRVDTSQVFEGVKLEDRNFPGNFLLLKSISEAFSFRKRDILAIKITSEGRVRVTMRNNCIGMRITAFRVFNDEDIAFGVPVMQAAPKCDTKKNAKPADVKRVLLARPAARTLASVAANWSNSCILGDTQDNNCAHFLSDAFIRAGFDELKKISSDPSINEWCDWNSTTKSPNARPIRAKEMWAWFKSMAQKTKRDKPQGQGFWATFQWDQSYSGGHVLLYDSDNNVVFGTGAYWNWSDQYYYQW
jgi:hypothetical protein